MGVATFTAATAATAPPASSSTGTADQQQHGDNRRNQQLRAFQLIFSSKKEHLESLGNRQDYLVAPDVPAEGVHVGRRVVVGSRVLGLGIGPGQTEGETLVVLSRSQFVVGVVEEVVVAAGGTPVAGIDVAGVVRVADVGEDVEAALANGVVADRSR